MLHRKCAMPSHLLCFYAYSTISTAHWKQSQKYLHQKPPTLKGSVKLKGIIISGEDDESHPAEIRLYKNIPQMSFDDTSREPEQAFRLNRDPLAELEYPTKIARFSNVQHLSVHISRNFGAESTRVYYIGLRGEFTEAHRHEVTICNYEAAANPADHKVESITPQTQFIS
ncbi:PITH domain-containing protein 1 isoform X2 [Myxocyprinus asiaticus]|uniref:PITH domain-containing protein 1 isoform X2 n=1 Tax=Myxocyprinus asiaticus TaxID=70543 RepID=UPI002221DD99|nr:PITH domain-containing protein 1 isoform X2 [Myxocyprinus asiaticus]